MNVQSSRYQIVLRYALPLLIIATSVLLSRLLNHYPELAIGITYDLTIVSPLVYLWLIRKTNIPRITAMPFFVAGVLVAGLILPEQLSFHLNLITTFLVPLVELLVVIFIVRNASRLSKIWKTKAIGETDSFSLIRASAVELLGSSRLTEVLVTEIAMFSYAFWSWKKKRPTANQFTVYKDSGAVALYGAIIFIILTETFVVHLLLMRYTLLVWILSIASVYTAIQLFAHIKALKQRFVEISGNQLFLRSGLFAEAQLDISWIERMDCHSADLELPDRKIEKLAFLKGLESHNVALYLNREIEIKGPYGIKRTCDVLLIQVDEPKQFVAVFNNACNHLKS